MEMKEYELASGFKKMLGPVADPAPPFLPFWERLAKDQQIAILVKEIDNRIRVVEFEMETLKLELDRLETLKSMVKR